MKLNHSPEFKLLSTGDIALSEMLDAITKAQVSVRLEMYIFHESEIAGKFRDALIAACQRGVKVKVLNDSLGSVALSASYWDEFKKQGGEFRFFNPLKYDRFVLRDHRKIITCDEEVGFIGGVNIATEYTGDGVTSGWRDLGMRITGPMVKELVNAFDEMFALADFKPRRFARFRPNKHSREIATDSGKLLLSAPGWRNPMRFSLRHDLHKAKDVRIMCAYFLPSRRMCSALIKVVRRGGKVQLILPGKSDVVLMQLASRSLYRRLLRAGVEIYEYQPQILHAKLIVADNITYVGSANLDTRSLQINYELLARIENQPLAAEARELFESDLNHCEKIELKTWKKSRTFWTKLKSHWAYWILARLDPYFARMQVKLLRQSATQKPV